VAFLGNNMKKELTLIISNCGQCYYHQQCGSHDTMCVHKKAIRKNEEGIPFFRKFNLNVDFQKSFPEWCPLKDVS
jgi:ribosomal 30S subunit maturation factor RimM